MTTNWSPQQDAALLKAAKWLRDPMAAQVFYLAGYAGTGKTTLAKHLVDEVRWKFAAFTGKAAHVLRQKGCHEAQTIHSLIYRPAGESKSAELENVAKKIWLIEQEEERTTAIIKRLSLLRRIQKELMEENQPRFVLWSGSPLAEYDVDGIVIDEVSMVDKYLGRDLESFGKKILVLGDPAQLPPVGSGGYYTKREPDVMLTEVHRHARESGILRLATLIREGGKLSDFTNTADARVIAKCPELAWMVLSADQALCGLNKTRHAMNHRHRELIGHEDPGPIPGDRLVCLKNDRNLGLFNGSQWIVNEADNNFTSNITDLQVISEEDHDHRVWVESWLHHMIGKGDELGTMGWDRGDRSEFDWAYAMTVHKSQGSQWANVVLFDQSRHFRQDARKWLYTGITRASEELTVVV